jgi:deoxyribose-phosphate aldolase
MPENKGFAQYIDHTLLKPEATEAEVAKVCDEAREYSFKTVCVESKWIPMVAKRLKGTAVLPITVISFPKGEDPSPKKAADTLAAVQAGAKEIDMVLNRTLLKRRDHAAVFEDIQAVVEAAGAIPVKVILETSELTREEKLMACALCKAAGAKFVKTSTGFSKSGATVEDVRLMREAVGPEMGVKASGGIRTTQDAKNMLAAGANRLGCSASIAIVQGQAGGGAGGY